MNTMRTTARNVVAGIRRHPGRPLAICVLLLAASVFAGTTVASAGPQATLAVSPSELHATPAPFVMNFADSLTGKRVQQVHKHASRVPLLWNSDGCDHDYGTPNQCVPWKIPGPAGQHCAWLKSNGFGPLRVYVKDRQDLDTNLDGIACDNGDRGVS